MAIQKIYITNKTGSRRSARDDKNWLKMTLILVLTLSSCAKTQVQKVDHLRLGYLLNMTHAVPIVGLETESFTETEGQFFMSGGYLLNALLTNNVDIAYIGPGPYLNALNKGVKLKLLAVSSIGANSLILAENYDLKETYVIKKLAVPQLGNTQDLLAKILVKKISARNNRVKMFSKEMKDLIDSEKIRISKKLDYIPVSPAELEMAFYTKAIDSALVAEPWGTMLESKGLVNLSTHLSFGPRDMVEELDGAGDNGLKDTLKLINKYPATLLVVKEEFYKVNQARVDTFVIEQNEVLAAIQEESNSAVALVKSHLENKTKKSFGEAFLLSSFSKVKFSDKLDKTRLQELANIAREVKYFRKDLIL